MHFLLFLKYFFVAVSCAGILIGYWVLFYDEDWEWNVGSLAGDFLATLLLLLMLLINPLRLGRFGQDMGPVRFLLGFAALAGLLGFMAHLTLSAA